MSYLLGTRLEQFVVALELFIQGAHWGVLGENSNRRQIKDGVSAVSFHIKSISKMTHKLSWKFPRKLVEIKP